MKIARAYNRGVVCWNLCLVSERQHYVDSILILKKREAIVV
jgi:hypothetical protein